MAKRQQEAMTNLENSGKGLPTNATLIQPNTPVRGLPKLDKGPAATTFYFYNPTTVSFGQLEFKKIGENEVQMVFGAPQRQPITQLLLLRFQKM